MRRGFRAVLLTIAGGLAAAPAGAQTRPIVTLDNLQSVAEIGGAASLSGFPNINRPPECETRGLPCSSSGDVVPAFGLTLLATGYFNEIVGVTGEVSAYVSQWESYGPCPAYAVPSSRGCALNQTNHVQTAMAGLRIRSRLITADRGTTHWRFFGQLVGGPEWSDLAPLHQVLQPGVGADDYLKNGLIVHVEYAYRFSPDDRRDSSGGRYLVGLVVPIGSR
jgi:hypothetical protein